MPDALLNVTARIVMADDGRVTVHLGPDARLGEPLESDHEERHLVGPALGERDVSDPRS